MRAEWSSGDSGSASTELTTRRESRIAQAAIGASTKGAPCAPLPRFAARWLRHHLPIHVIRRAYSIDPVVWCSRGRDVRIWNTVRTAEQICEDAGGDPAGLDDCRL
jgi:hypothetical protein